MPLGAWVPLGGMALECRSPTGDRYSTGSRPDPPSLATAVPAVPPPLPGDPLRAGAHVPLGWAGAPPDERHDDALRKDPHRVLLHGSHRPSTMAELQQEHRESHLGSHANKLAKYGGAPALSRFRGEDEEMRALAKVLRDSARVRSECANAAQGVASSFERDFKPSSNQRSAASFLVQKGASIAQRLQASCRSVEAAAAACMSVAQLGCVEREALITSLQAEITSREDELTRASARQREWLQRDHERRAMRTVVAEHTLLNELAGDEEATAHSTAALAEARARIAALEEEAAESAAERAEMARLRRQAAEHMAAIEGVRRALGEEKADLEKALLLEREARTKEAASARAASQQLTAERDRLAASVGELKRATETATKRQQRAEVDCASLRAQQSAATLQLESHGRDMAEVQSKLHAAEKQLQKLGVRRPVRRERVAVSDPSFSLQTLL